MIMVAHFTDELAVAGGGVDCVNGCFRVDTLSVDTLSVDTLSVDTLSVDTLRPWYRIVPYPRPQINDIVFDYARIYQIGVYPSKQNLVFIAGCKCFRKGMFNQ